MKLPVPLIEGRLIRRYKRFLADVRLPDGSEGIAHCPNTGSMLGCQPEDARVWLSTSDNPKRKLKYTWELVETAPGEVACINTARPNAQAREAIESGDVPELAAYQVHKREVKLNEGSRVDFLLSEPGDCVVEVKSVTLGLEGGVGAFPDAVSTRASRHLEELIQHVEQGDRAVLLLLAMHTGIERIAPADPIDPKYGDTLRRAVAAGVEVLCYGCEVSAAGVRLSRPLPFMERLPEDL